MTAAILHPSDSMLAGLVLLAAMAALLLYVHVGRYILRRLDRALVPDDDREAVRAIRERGGWVSSGWTP